MLVGLFSEQHTTILASITALGISEKYFAESARNLATWIFPFMQFGLHSKCFLQHSANRICCSMLFGSANKFILHHSATRITVHMLFG